MAQGQIEQFTDRAGAPAPARFLGITVNDSFIETWVEVIRYKLRNLQHCV